MHGDHLAEAAQGVEEHRHERGEAGDRLPAELAVGEERRETLLRAIRTLPQELREVVTLRYLLELSEAETAETLGVPKGTVKSRTSRALTRLRTLLAVEEVPGA